MPLTRDAVIRLRLGKHHLPAAVRADNPMAVIRDLVGLHATDPRSPYHQLRVRTSHFAPEELDALLDDGQVARVGCMRGTLFLQAAESLPLVVSATRRVVSRDDEKHLAANGISAARYRELAAEIREVTAGRALDARGIRAALATEEAIPAVLHVMCDEGVLVRWKGPRGWRGAGQTYRPLAEVIPGIDLRTLDERAAIRELVRRYLLAYGPVTHEDVRWWSGLTASAVKEAIRSLGSEVVVVGVEGADVPYLVHSDDHPQPAPPGRGTPDVSFLPTLDPYLQGYKHRDLPVDAAQLRYVSDTKGNTTSVVLVDGRVAGVWDEIRGPAPELRVLFLTQLARAVREQVLAEAVSAAGLLGGAGVPVVEVHAMTPLAQRSGWVLSPLADRAGDSPGERAVSTPEALRGSS